MYLLIDALASWQSDAGPFQLHPGDIGWHWRFGEDATRAVVRAWEDGGEIVAVALADGPTLWRFALSPSAHRDESLARRIHRDIDAAGKDTVEAPNGSALREVLVASGWLAGESWTPLVRDLFAPVESQPFAVDVTAAASIDDRVSVQRAAFENSTFTAERWLEMSSGPVFAGARCLILRDEAGRAVAAATVWTAGSGRPGLIEPLGVHKDHRGKGYGTAVAIAAVAALRDLGASSAVVATPTSNRAAVAAYQSAGLVAREPIVDLTRPQG